MLSASGLTRSIGTRILFRGVTLQLGPGRRVALIGGNGTGKTTMLEILVGLQDPDSGEVHRPGGVRIGYLPQEIPPTSDCKVLEEVLRGAETTGRLAERIVDLAGRLSDTEGTKRARLLAEYGEAQARFEQVGGYATEAEAHRILAGLGFAPTDHQRPLGELSGGWRMRVALARLLLAAPDLLVLDEPTNHLDVDSVAWLEDHLAGWRTGLLFVSHDRDFIDAVANRVLELSGGRVTEYVGGFAEFVVAREERLADQRAMAAHQARETARTERFVERFRYKASKARQVQSRVKALERLERIVVEEPDDTAARFGFPVPRRSSRVVVELEGVDAGYDGSPVLRDVSFAVERGMNVALVGPNGAGKTTLVRLITGELEALAGRVRLGTGVDLASVDQLQAEVLDPDRTVLSELRTVTDVEPPGRNLRTYLASFGFRGDVVDQRVGELSGGEQTRLALAKALAVPVNLLVLDEPTNHLDLPSCDILEDALTAYPGTVVLITHDRHLIRSVADHLIEVRDGRASWHIGVPEHLLYPVAAQPPIRYDGDGRDIRAKSSRGPKKNGKTDPDRELRRRLTRAERDWEEAEAELADLQTRLGDPDLYRDPETAASVVAEHEAAKDRAAESMATWENLDREMRS